MAILGDQLVADYISTNEQAGLVLIPFSGAYDNYDFGDSGGVSRNVSLSMTASVGKTINGFWPGTVADNTSVSDFYMGAASIVSTDGTVTPIFYGQPVTPQGLYNNCSTASTLMYETDPSGADAATYYIDDQLGTAQMEISGLGTPLWQGQFTPFGQQILAGGEQIAVGQVPVDNTTNRYKFTGKERDAESGLDYFGARYYGSNMGRFMSPDWSSLPVGVPYASLSDPQSLNLYSYVLNNPLSHRDLDGHSCAPDTSSTGKDGSITVTAGACTPDWWQFQAARRFLGQHKTAVKVTANVVIGVTAISGVFDAGASEAAIPGEIALEEALLEGGELAAEGAGESAAGAANSANHIFGEKNLAKHGLEKVLEASGGKAQAYQALQKATAAATQGTSGLFQKVVQVAGQDVTVRGNVINGVARISTAFITK